MKNADRRLLKGQTREFALPDLNGWNKSNLKRAGTIERKQGYESFFSSLLA
jgi:hypothetical protein